MKSIAPHILAPHILARGRRRVCEWMCVWLWVGEGKGGGVRCYISQYLRGGEEEETRVMNEQGRRGRRGTKHKNDGKTIEIFHFVACFWL